MLDGFLDQPGAIGSGGNESPTDPNDPGTGGPPVDPIRSRTIIYPLDRRPIKVIDFYDPNQEDTLNVKWSKIDTAYDWLSDAISAGYDLGYRRFMFNLPAGNAISITPQPAPISGSLWFPLDVEHRDLLLGKIADLLATYISLGCEFGLMGGIYVDQLDSNQMRSPRLPSPTNRDDAIFIHDNWTNWLDIGITSFVAYDGMDPSATNVFPTLRAYSNLFWSRGFRVYGKGLPLNSSTKLATSLLEVLGTMVPWSALRSFEHDAGSQDVTRRAYEVFVDLHPNNAVESLGEVNVPFTKADVASLLSRGFYVASWENSAEGEATIMSAYKDAYPRD